METIDFITKIRVPFTIKVYRVKGYDKQIKQLKDFTILIMHDGLNNQSKIIDDLKSLKLRQEVEDIKVEVPVAKDKKLIQQKLLQKNQLLKSFKLIRHEYYYDDFACEIYMEDDVFKIWIGSEKYNKALTKIDAELLKDYYNRYPGNYFYGDKKEELNQLSTLDLTQSINQTYTLTYAHDYAKDLDSYRYIYAEETRIKKLNPHTITTLSNKLYEIFGDYKTILKIIDQEVSVALIPYKVKLNIEKVGIITLHACVEIKPDSKLIDEIINLTSKKNTSIYNLVDKYFIIEAKGGHVGREYFMRINLPIMAKSGKEAALKARWTPRVKHHHEDAIIQCKEVSYETYLKQVEENDKDNYFKCQSSKDHKLYELEFDKRKEIDLRNYRDWSI